MNITKILFSIISLSLLIYLIWSFVNSILYILIATLVYIISMGLFYEKNIGSKYPDDKKIIFKIMRYCIKLPNEINIVREDNSYKFNREQLGHFIYLFTMIHVTIIFISSIFIIPNIFSVLIIIKCFFTGLGFAVISNLIVIIHCEYFSKIH